VWPLGGACDRDVCLGVSATFLGCRGQSPERMARAAVRSTVDEDRCLTRAARARAALAVDLVHVKYRGGDAVVRDDAVRGVPAGQPWVALLITHGHFRLATEKAAQQRCYVLPKCPGGKLIE